MRFGPSWNQRNDSIVLSGMSSTMLRRIAVVLLPALHHGISPPAETPGETADGIARKVLQAMREPTDFMIDAGERAASSIGMNDPQAVVTYTAMIDAALSEGSSHG